MSNKDLPTGAQFAQATKFGWKPIELWPTKGEAKAASKLPPSYAEQVLVRLKDDKPEHARFVVLQRASADLAKSLADQTIELYESEKRERVTAELTDWRYDARSSDLSAKLTVTSAGRTEILRGDKLVMYISLRVQTDDSGNVLKVLDGIFAQADRSADAMAQASTARRGDNARALLSRLGWK